MPLNLEATEPPQSDLDVFERLAMPPWMSESFYAADGEENRLRMAAEAQAAVARKRRERDQAYYDVWEFKLRHKLP